MNKKDVLFEIIRIEESDRLMAITRDDSGVLIGLNFWQGVDSGIDVFNRVGYSEEALLQFVKNGLICFEKSDKDIEFLNNLCSMHLYIKMGIEL
tara:strand:+ start:1829 stop:2110 length:282 start_codon:yes stop_codon:yes gene_type:complete